MIRQSTDLQRNGSADEAHGRASPGAYCDALILNLYDSGDSESGLLPTIGVTSCVHGEGVTTIATNLATHVAQTTRESVLLFEVSTNRPSIEESFGIESKTEFSDFVSRHVEIAERIEATPIRNLSAVAATAGQDGWGNLSPRSIARIVRELREQFAFVVVDLPPASELGPCLAIASHLDAVLLTVEAERVSSEVAQRAKKRLIDAGANLRGVVLNKCREHAPEWFRRRG